MKKHISRLILFLCALMVAIILTGISRKIGQPEIAVNHVAKIIHKQEKAAEEIADLVRSESVSSPYIFEGLSSVAIKDHGFHGFLFYDSVLSFWSDNRIPIDRSQLLSLSHDTTLCTGNLISYCKVWAWDDFQFYLLIPLKQNFNYENRYLKNGFLDKYRLHRETKIMFDENVGYPVLSYDSKYLFSLSFSDLKYTYPYLQFLILLCYFIALIFLSLFVLELYRVLPPFKSRPVLRAVLSAVDMALLYGLIKIIGLPSYISDTRLFDPSLYAHNVIISSMGDLLVIAILFFFSGYFWFVELRKSKRRYSENSLQKRIQAIGLMSFVVLCVHFSFVLIYSLVVNSTISFDLITFFELNLFSVLGFFIMVLLLGGSWLIFMGVIRYLKECCNNIFNYFLVVGTVLLLFVLLWLFFPSNYPIIVSISTVIFVVFSAIEFYFREDHIDPGIAVLVIAMFSIISGFLLSNSWQENRESEMRMMALSVSNQRDRVAEFLFEENVEQMKSDARLHKLAIRAVYNIEREEVLMDYVKENYLSGYWKQFDYQVTACDDYVDLSIGGRGEVMNCSEYFGSLRNRYGMSTFGEHLYFINDSSGMVSYLGQVELYPPAPDMDTVTLYIDIIPKYVQEGLGYPELMIDGQFENTIDYGGYSWAMFLNGTLVRNVGEYFYSSKLARYSTDKKEDHFFTHNGWSHYLYHAGDGMTVMVSCSSGKFIDKIAPFSYLFLFISLVVLILYATFLITRRDTRFKFTTRNRLQIFVTGFLFLALAVVGYSSVRYILVLNSDKNRQNLQEKAHSVLTELEHKLSTEQQFDAELYDYLSALFTKWSNVFFSDINLYNPDGELLVSSRQEIFDESLTSTRMDASAYKALALDRKTQFICNEQIGSYSYLSAWVQFRNSDNDLVAYLNLPFFARQSELSREVSVFLITFINIYVLLIVIALLIGLLLSNIISKPLERIREKMAKLSLGSDNEKLEWFRDDEIGALVREYNVKVDELASNAAKLAQTERETAWREMARQVAHEIKNPLTPMKLSVQHLKRAWDDNAPDFDHRLKRFTDTMTEQIDSMAEIATAFSDFARMPRAQQETLQLNDLILNSIDLFNDSPGISIDKQLTMQDTTVFADSKQLLRVFNNLMKNSIQALDGKDNGVIRIETWREENAVMVLFADNGSGIPDEKADMIFAPNFTTKSGGMGLGLAMVKNIVLNHGGQIWFESNGETVFYISLPVCDE